MLATCGEFREGYRFVKIAMGLSKQLKSREASSEVFAIASQVMILVEPLQSLDDFTIQGHKIGLASGNTNRSFICLVLNQSVNFW